MLFIDCSAGNAEAWKMLPIAIKMQPHNTCSVHPAFGCCSWSKTNAIAMLSCGINSHNSRDCKPQTTATALSAIASLCMPARHQVCEAAVHLAAPAALHGAG
jgi:hypothetical protein